MRFRLGTTVLLALMVGLGVAVGLGIGIPFGPELLALVPLLILAYAIYRLIEWVWRRVRGRGRGVETH